MSGPISENTAEQNYNQTFMHGLSEGFIAGRADDPEWRDHVYQVPYGDSAGDNILLTDMSGFRSALPQFGEGKPMTYTHQSLYEMTIDSARRAISFSIDRDKLSEDRVGYLMDGARDLGEGAAQSRIYDFWGKMTGDAFAGTNGFECLDGAPLISDSHPIKGSSSFWSNKGTAKFSQAAYRNAIADIRKAVSPDGNRPSKATQFLVVVGSDYEHVAAEVFDSSLIVSSGAAVDNVNKTARYRVSSYLDDLGVSDYWFIFVTRMNPSMAGVRFKGVEEPAVVPSLDPASDNVRLLNRYEWTVSMKYGFGAGMPVGIWGSDGSA